MNSPKRSRRHDDHHVIFGGLPRNVVGDGVEIVHLRRWDAVGVQARDDFGHRHHLVEAVTRRVAVAVKDRPDDHAVGFVKGIDISFLELLAAR